MSFWPKLPKNTVGWNYLLAQPRINVADNLIVVLSVPKRTKSRCNDKISDADNKYTRGANINGFKNMQSMKNSRPKFVCENHTILTAPVHTRLHVLLFCLCSTFDDRTEKINHNSGSELWSFKITVFSVHHEPRLVRLSSSFFQVQIGSKSSHGVRRAFSGVCFREKPRSAGWRFKSITLLGSLVCDKKNLLTHVHTKQAIGAVFPVGPGGEGVLNFANHHLTTIAFEETGSYQNNSYLYKITRALISWHWIDTQPLCKFEIQVKINCLMLLQLIDYYISDSY